jgi:hypothetical protein
MFSCGISIGKDKVGAASTVNNHRELIKDMPTLGVD